MKKLLSGIVAIVVLMALATNVKAATMGGNDTVEQGKEINVTVTMQATDNFGVKLNYDASKLTYMGATSNLGKVEDTNAGMANGVATATVSKPGSTITSVTLTFKAKDTIGKAENFTVKAFNGAAGDTLTGSLPIEVVEAKGENSGNQGTTGNEGTGSEAQGTQGGTTTKKVNDKGEVIKKLPKTGTSYVAVAGLALAVIGSAVIARKISK